MREISQNLSYKDYKDYKLMSLKLKLIKNINTTVSYIMSSLWVIAIIEFIRFCFDLYSYLH